MGLSDRVRDAIELMVFGGEDGRPVGRAQAALAVGLKDESLRKAFGNPDVVAHYNAQLEALRTSERGRNLATAIEIRDSALEGAAGAVARLKAAAQVEGRPEPGAGAQVNVQLNQFPPQQPGYVIAVDPRFADEVPASMLRKNEG